jgi:hypothetical protein
MLENTFVGKVLVSHPSHVVVLDCFELGRFLSPFAEKKSVILTYNRFGSSKVVKMGVLMGTLEKESRIDLTKRVEELVLKLTKNQIPVVLSRERLYSTSTKQSPHKEYV